MACEQAGRGRCALKVRDIDLGEVWAPGTAVVLVGDAEPVARYTVAAVEIEMRGAGQFAVGYILARPDTDGRGRPDVHEFRVGAALVELADKPAAEDRTASTGLLRWADRDQWIEDESRRFSIWPQASLGAPLYYASDRTGKGTDRHSDAGTLTECKDWCEARPAAPTTATVAGVDGVPQAVPAADAPEF